MHLKPRKISCLARGMNNALCRMFWTLAISWTAYQKLIAIFFLPFSSSLNWKFCRACLVCFLFPPSSLVHFVSDLNECGLKPRPCKHRCMNTYGSYKCYCLNGYMLMPDGTCSSTASLAPCSFPASQNPCSSFPGKLLWNEDESRSKRLILLEVRQLHKTSSFFLVKLGWKKQEQLFWFYLFY